MKEMVFKVMGVVYLTLLSGVASSQQTDNEVAKAAEGNAASHEHTGSSGRMVFIDPETGKVASGQRQIDLSGLSQQQSTGVIPTPGVASAPERLANGTIKISLNGQFTIPLTVSVDDDGNLEKGHHIDVDKGLDNGVK